MSAENVIEMVENDTLPELSVTYNDVDLTGYAIELHIKYNSANGGTLTKTATVTSAADGEFKFTWAAGDLKPGRWPAEIEIVDASGKVITFHGLIFNIVPEIG